MIYEQSKLYKNVCVLETKSKFVGNSAILKDGKATSLTDDKIVLEQ